MSTLNILDEIYDWEQRKLGDIGETFSGLSGKNINDFGHGDANFITYMNVFSNSIADLRGTEHVEIDSKQNQVIYGDILFTTSSETPEEVGMSSVWLGHTKNTYLNSFCFGYRILEKPNFDSYYMAYLLRAKKFRKRMTVLAQGISRYNISKKQVMNTFVNFPTIEEQRRIGKHLFLIDRTITLHEEKQRQLEQLKKALLQKMFADETGYPVFRFKGFTEKWEQRKLGEIADVYDGVHQTPDYQDSGVMFLSVENIKTLKSNKYISEKAFEKKFKIFPEQGDILMTRIGDIGTTNIVQTSKRLGYYVSLALLKPKNIASHYLNSVIATPSFQISLKRRSLLTATPQKINKDEIGKVYFFMPHNLQEQEKIGQFFQSLDKTITLHDKKIQYLKQLKRGLLQKMFI